MTGKPQSTFEKITAAREVLGLPEKATFREIQDKYKILAKQWHPDMNPDDPDRCHAMMQKINDAYRVITDYCKIYRISFLKEDVDQYRSPGELWMEKFGDDPMWGSGREGM
ncbi:J domain-containing protein [bacterium]|nr:J domain-containing protein [bacterium]